jgi:hypothetical protein
VEHEIADRLLGTREIGRRLAQGPWQDLGKAKWGIPTVAYMSQVLTPDVILERVPEGFVHVKAKAPPPMTDRAF